MNIHTEAREPSKTDHRPLLFMIMRCVALAMGVAVAALSRMGMLSLQDGMGMLGIGLACLAIPTLDTEKPSKE